MGSNPEIITLQFGNYTNHVGAHWWNIQEAQFNYDSCSDPGDINHDVLYREGLTYKGEVTFTPRMLLVDLQGSLTNYPKEGDLYEVPNDSIDDIKSGVLWAKNKIELFENPEKNEQEKMHKKINEFQKDLKKVDVDLDSKDYNFKDTVTEWSDYQFARYHPKSANIVKKYLHNANETTFDTYPCGVELWKTYEFIDDFSDKIRNMIEECDNCQGFQILFDAYDGFSGLASKCTEYIGDEYGKSLLCIPIFAPNAKSFKNTDVPMNDSIRLMNIALTFSQLSESSSFFIPLSTMNRVWRSIDTPQSFNGIDYLISDNFYQTSAIIASYLDTISLRYRLKAPTGDSYLSYLCTDLNRYGRKLAAAGIRLPLGMTEDEYLIEYLDSCESLFNNLSPNTDVGTQHVIQSISLRGIKESQLKKPREKAGTQLQMAAYNCRSVSEMIQLYYQCSYYRSIAHVTSIEEPLKIKQPYPREIFSKTLSKHGCILKENPLNVFKIESLSCFANIQVSNTLGNTLESLYRDTRRIKFNKIHRFKESGLEYDEYEESLERLLSFKENYDEGFDL